MSEKNYHLGLVSVSFRSETPEKIIEATVKSGLGAIEWGSDIHAPFDDEKKLKKIAKLQKEYGIICSSYGTYFRLGKTPLHELERYIAAAKVMGTDILRLWCYDKCRADMTEKEVDELLEESFLAYQEGMKLLKQCNDTIDKVEKQVLALNKDGELDEF